MSLLEHFFKKQNNEPLYNSDGSLTEAGKAKSGQ